MQITPVLLKQLLMLLVGRHLADGYFSEREELLFQVNNAFVEKGTEKQFVLLSDVLQVQALDSFVLLYSIVFQCSWIKRDNEYVIVGFWRHFF